MTLLLLLIQLTDLYGNVTAMVLSRVKHAIIQAEIMSPKCRPYSSNLQRNNDWSCGFIPNKSSVASSSTGRHNAIVSETARAIK